MLIFFWHAKNTLVVYAALTFFTIVVMAPYKWKKWMRIKTSLGMLVFGLSLAIDLFCWLAYR
jgi:predicted phosphatase